MLTHKDKIRKQIKKDKDKIRKQIKKDKDKIRNELLLTLGV